MEEDMFINYSNHPSEKWEQRQREEAEKYGEIKDMPFPNIGEEWSKERVIKLAEQEVKKIEKEKPDCVLCQGEMTFTYALVNELKKIGIKTVSATSRREVIEDNGVKISKFQFCRFREY